MTKKMLGVGLVALLLAACGTQHDEPVVGAAQVSVRSSALVENAVVTLKVFAGSGHQWNDANALTTESLGAGVLSKTYDALPVGPYTFCASAVDGQVSFGPTCVTVAVTKNAVAAVSLVLQQTGNGNHNASTPRIDGISISDTAPAYGEDVQLSVSASYGPGNSDAPGTFVYAWSATCGEQVLTFSDAAKSSTTLKAGCQGEAQITISVTDGTVTASITFPLTYRPEGVTPTVSLNHWPAITGFTTSAAQIAPNGSTSVKVEVTDADTAAGDLLTYAWTKDCGGSLANSTQQTVTFTAPAAAAECTLTVVVSDARGGKSTGTVVVHVFDAALTQVVLDLMPATMPVNAPSLAFESTQTYEWGDVVRPAGTARHAVKATVLMSNWFPESYTHPITLKLYTVDGGVLTPYKQVTTTASIPARPPANPEACGGDTDAWSQDGQCYHGIAFAVEFDLAGITLPDTFAYGVYYDTDGYGLNPTHDPAGGYNALNVIAAISSAGPGVGGVTPQPVPTVGIDVDPYAIVYNGAPRISTSPNSWQDLSGISPAIRFTAW